MSYFTDNVQIIKILTEAFVLSTEINNISSGVFYKFDPLENVTHLCSVFNLAKQLVLVSVDCFSAELLLILGMMGLNE